MSTDFYNNFESAITDLELSFKQNYLPLAFRVNLRANILNSLPLPNFLAAIIVFNSRLNFPKGKMKPINIPKNSNIFAKMPPTKGNYDVFMLPNEVNEILTKYAQDYLSYQFTIKFIQYIKSPGNGIKSIISDNQNLQETLAYFKDNPANTAILQLKFQETENNSLMNLSAVAIRILLKPDILGWNNAKGLIQELKPQLDNWITKFFRKGKFEILRQSGFKEATILDNIKTSDVGYNLIRKYEKFVPKLYSNDGGGRGGNCTIGYGHLIHRGPCTSADFAKYANGISQPEAEGLLKTDVEVRENIIRMNVKVLLTQNQFDALVSFLFTSGGFSQNLLTKLNAGDFDGVPEEMKKIIYSGGKLAPGLVTRREEETQLFSNK